MIQTIGKILIILMVTALVAAGLYALVQGGSANTAASGQQFSRNNNEQPARTEGFREHGGERGASLGRGMGGVLVTVLEIGAITFIVLQVQKVLAKPSRPNTPNPA